VKANFEAWPGARDLSFAEDVMAQEMVDDLGPLTFDEMADVLGESREAIEQEVKDAKRKLHIALAANGTLSTTLEWLEEREALADARAETEYL
jgi:predicted DNA-binding protein (UPF0251 family)